MKFEIDGVFVDYKTQPDLFSPKGLDQGTRLLLAHLTKFKYNSLLDWGCGWGAIAIFAAKSTPYARIVAIDSDLGAIKMVCHNTKLNGLDNLTILASHGYDELPKGQKFDIICSNPPTHRGREVVEQMIEQSKDRLMTSGRLIVVVESRLKPWVVRHFTKVFGSCEVLARNRKNTVIMAQKQPKAV